MAGGAGSGQRNAGAGAWENQEGEMSVKSKKPAGGGQKRTVNQDEPQ